MKIKLSKELSKYTKNYSDIEKYFTKNERTPQIISQYSALTSIPLFVVYVYLIQVEHCVELKKEFLDICKYYDYDNDIIA